MYVRGVANAFLFRYRSLVGWCELVVFHNQQGFCCLGFSESFSHKNRFTIYRHITLPTSHKSLSMQKMPRSNQVPPAVNEVIFTSCYFFI